MSMLTIRRLASGLVRHGGTGSGPISCIVLQGKEKTIISLSSLHFPTELFCCKERKHAKPTGRELRCTTLINALQIMRQQRENAFNIDACIAINKAELSTATRLGLAMLSPNFICGIKYSLQRKIALK